MARSKGYDSSRRCFLRESAACVLLCWLLLARTGVLADAPSDQSEGPVPLDDDKAIVAEKDSMNATERIENSKRRFQDPYFQTTLKEYWRKTLLEIRNLAPRINMTSSGSSDSFYSQWKQLLDDTQISSASNRRSAEEEKSRPLSSNATFLSLQRPWGSQRRFEGFLSWDRLVQEWSDEIQEYLDMIQDASLSSGEYPMSSYGVPREVIQAESAKGSSDQLDDDSESSASKLDDELDAETVETTTEEPTEKVALPTPKAAQPGQAVLPHTDLSDLSKRLWIVTTASMPWRTGTAVNPLLRAAYLCSKERTDAGGSVTLMLPWLERQGDQDRVYGTSKGFSSKEEQTEFIRTWLRDSAGLRLASEDLNIEWYTAWQNPVENSIYSMGDITALIPDDACDIMILEEPEHLNWYRAPGESWTKKFKHVVGILHTNYFQYVLDQPAALIRAPAMKLLTTWMCRAHCHRLIKLSGTLGKVAPEKELVENVHGVRGTFLDIGREVGRRIQQQNSSSVWNFAGTEPDSVFGPDATPTVYFLGKLLLSKGIFSLLELLKYAEETAGLRVKVDMYGSGLDQEAAEAKAEKLGLEMPFHGPLDHAELAYSHKIFVNPSTSEVLCTASAEALAMGKFVILPSHPSNDFFAQFPNCLAYATKEEFVGNLYYAMTHSPEPLSPESLHALSWEAATERLMAAACIPVEEAEAFKAAHTAREASIEITLPPLVEDDSTRTVLASTFRKTRGRYRIFRTMLSSELRHNKVLPTQLRDRLVADLDKRLDLDIDELLESPKLRLQLSPAELDKSLLELYDTVSKSPGGDLLRVICGGGPIGLQNLYMRRRTQKNMYQQGVFAEFFPSPLDDESDRDELVRRTPVQRIRWALRKNVPSNGNVNGTFTPNVPSPTPTTSSPAPPSQTKPQGRSMTMCTGTVTEARLWPAQSGRDLRSTSRCTWAGLRPLTSKTAFTGPMRKPLSLSLLI